MRLSTNGAKLLRATNSGGSFEDRQDLLGHKSSRITTHYSAAELGSLIAAANKVCGQDSRNYRSHFDPGASRGCK